MRTLLHLPLEIATAFFFARELRKALDRGKHPL